MNIVSYPTAHLLASTTFNRSLFYCWRTMEEHSWLPTDYLEGVRTYLEEYGEGSALAKVAGQLCYMSFKGKYTPFSETEKYLRNIKEQGHGSVLEHASYTFLLTGVDRADTHELVRHRAGMAFSQVSQRYVDKPSFVVPVNLRGKEDTQEYSEWLKWVESVYKEYTYRLGLDYETLPVADRKLRVESARRCLPNETEAPIIATGNLRAWRHIIAARCSKYADASIRAVISTVFDELNYREPHVFNDFTKDSSGYITTEFPKV